MFGVSKQAYYKARKEPTDETKVLVEEIIVKYCEDVRQKDPNIGGKKLWFMFCRQFPKELHVGRDRFADILSDNHLKLRQKKRKPRTTDSRHNLPTYPNLIKDVIPSRPYQVWVSDITYIPIKVSDWESGFAYLSLITDAYSHEVMGWRLGRDLSNRPALQALSMAFRIANERGVDICNGGLVHHSDRGVQYASKEYVEKLRSARIGISMTECGDPKENAIAERINSTLKNEILDKRMISLKYANGLRNGANSDTHRCKQLTEHGEERCIKLREVAGFSAVRTIFQIVGPRKILHCLLGK